MNGLEARIREDGSSLPDLASFRFLSEEKYSSSFTTSRSRLRIARSNAEVLVMSRKRMKRDRLSELGRKGCSCAYYHNIRIFICAMRNICPIVECDMVKVIPRKQSIDASVTQSQTLHVFLQYALDNSLLLIQP